VAHVCWTLGIGSVTLVAASCLSADQRWLVLAAMIIATASSLAYYGPMWAMVTRLVPVSALAIGIGIINGVGNLGGFVGPYVGGVLIDLTGSMVAAQLFFAAALLGAAVIIFSLRGQMRAAVGELAERTPVR
jgi:nitrate/nitrite transporter NarK